MKLDMMVETHLVSETKKNPETSKEYDVTYLEVNTPYGKQRIYLDKYNSRAGIILDIYLKEKGEHVI